MISVSKTNSFSYLSYWITFFSACKFNFDLSSVIEETAKAAAARAALPARSPKTSESSETCVEKKRSNRYSENSDGGSSSDSSGQEVCTVHIQSTSEIGTT